MGYAGFDLRLQPQPKKFIARPTSLTLHRLIKSLHSNLIHLYDWPVCVPRSFFIYLACDNWQVVVHLERLQMQIMPHWHRPEIQVSTQRVRVIFLQGILKNSQLKYSGTLHVHAELCQVSTGAASAPPCMPPSTRYGASTRITHPLKRALDEPFRPSWPLPFTVYKIKATQRYQGPTTRLQLQTGCLISGR